MPTTPLATTTYMTAEEAARDFAGLLVRVRAGERVVIDDAAPPVEVRMAERPRLRLLSESLRMARERGSKVTLDDQFGRDVQAGIDSHTESLRNPWE